MIRNERGASCIMPRSTGSNIQNPGSSNLPPKRKISEKKSKTDAQTQINLSSSHFDSEIIEETIAIQEREPHLRVGGPTGGDFAGGGGGPALGAKHPADDMTADHYGSRAETNAALEGKIAMQNSRRLAKR